MVCFFLFLLIGSSSNTIYGFLVNDDVTAPSIENQQQNDEATSMVRGIGTERFGNEMDYQQGTGQIVRRLRKEAFAGDQLLTVAEKEILRKWFKSKTSACICNRKRRSLQGDIKRAMCGKCFSSSVQETNGGDPSATKAWRGKRGNTGQRKIIKWLWNLRSQVPKIDSYQVEKALIRTFQSTAR